MSNNLANFCNLLNENVNRTHILFPPLVYITRLVCNKKLKAIKQQSMREILSHYSGKRACTIPNIFDGTFELKASNWQNELYPAQFSLGNLHVELGSFVSRDLLHTSVVIL